MPSFDETLDHTDNELLDLPSLPSNGQSRESSAESMRFIPSHFEDSEDDTQHVPSVLQSSKRKTDSAVQQIDAAAVARDVVAQAFSSVMGSMIQNSVLGSLQNVRGTREEPDGQGQERLDLASHARVPISQRLDQASADRFASTHSDSDDYDDEDDVTVGVSDLSDRSRRDDLVDSTISEDASSLNIEEEFDFLEEYEYGSSAEKK